MLRDDDLVNRMITPKRCVCGAKARVRYRIPYFWVECDKKCGMKTGYHIDVEEPCDFASEDEAVIEWNNMISRFS